MRSKWLTIFVGVALSCSDTAPTAPPAPPTPTVTTIQVAPGNTTLNWIGASREFTATVLDAAGSPMSGVAVTWTSTLPSVATVDVSTGVVTAVATGTTFIQATAGSVIGSITLTVQQVAASVSVTPGLDTLLAAGQTLTYSATVRDSGNIVIPSAPVRWTSESESVASIDSLSGLALGIAPGTATLTARPAARPSVSGSAALLVRDGTLVGDRVLLTDWGNINDNAYHVADYFAVWWDNQYDHAADAQQILDWLAVVKTQSLALGLQHPPNDAVGSYLNIYIHEPGPGNDNYPDDWGAGVGTDSNGLPYMALGSNVSTDPLFIRHEGFHLFQYTRSSPGFEYSGDGAWFTEASANWFAGLDYATDDRTYVAAGTVPANPQLALWHAFSNGPASDPTNWNRQVRQYGLNTWLHYLTTTGGAPQSVLMDGYNAGTTLLPQEYLVSRVNGLDAIFADWAAHNTAEMDYLTRSQWQRALEEIDAVGDAADRNEYVHQLVNDGTGGAYFEPSAALAPRGWSYNVIRVTSTSPASWQFEVDGAATGSDGAAAKFQARLLIRTADGDSIRVVALPDGSDGSIATTTGAGTVEMYLVVVAVPEHYRGNQYYPYRVRIDRVP